MHPDDPTSPREAVRSYRDLNLWKEAKALATDVLRIADGPTLSRRRALCDQISRSAISVPSNIAEGDERGFAKEQSLLKACAVPAEPRTDADDGHGDHRARQPQP